MLKPTQIKVHYFLFISFFLQSVTTLISGALICAFVIKSTRFGSSFNYTL